MTLHVRAEQAAATYSGGSWEIGTLRGSALHIAGQRVVGARKAAIADPAGGSEIDSEARLAINSILAAMRAHGLIEQ